MLLTAAPMATALPDLGARVLERLANAHITIGLQDIYGMLADEALQVDMGGMAVQARSKTMIVLGADLDEVVGGVSVNAECTLAGGLWVITQRTDNQPLPGQTTLELERP